MSSVVAVGGGHGLSVTLAALRPVGVEPTALVTVADDGGSSGRLRRDLGLLPPGDLRKRFEAAGIDLTRPVTTTCGSGITASVLAFALHLLGHPRVAVYDGSWTEWGGRADTPVES